MTITHPNTPVSATISAENTFTTPAIFNADFVIRIRGTWSATVTLQRSDDGGTTYDDVTTYTANALQICEEVVRGGATYRIGIKTGDYTSGDAVVQIG